MGILFSFADAFFFLLLLLLRLLRRAAHVDDPPPYVREDILIMPPWLDAPSSSTLVQGRLARSSSPYPKNPLVGFALSGEFDDFKEKKKKLFPWLSCVFKCVFTIASFPKSEPTMGILDVYEGTLERVDALLGVPVDEWTPQLGYNFEAKVGDAMALTYKSRWPTTTSASASLKRESTAWDTPLAALAAKVRGSRRAESRARSRIGQRQELALEARKRELRSHARWLSTPGAFGRSGRHVPRRIAMHRTCVVVPRDSQSSCDRQIAQRAKAEQLRFVTRISAVASVMLMLEGPRHRRPGHGRIVELGDRLRAATAENVEPAFASRSQFVAVCRSVLSLSERLANSLFSALDPWTTGRARCGTAIAVLLAAHRPDSSRLEADGGANQLVPLFRHVARAYDPEEDGVEVDEVTDFLACFATSRDEVVTMTAILARTPRLRQGALSTAEFIDLVLRDKNLHLHLASQLATFRAKVRTAFDAELADRKARALRTPQKAR